MNEKCEYDFCAQNKDGICEEVTCTGNVKVHKPEPNESPSSPRTSGSPTATRSDSPVEGTAVQLAPVIRPAVGAASEGGEPSADWCWRCKSYHTLDTPCLMPR